MFFSHTEKETLCETTLVVCFITKNFFPDGRLTSDINFQVFSLSLLVCNIYLTVEKVVSPLRRFQLDSTLGLHLKESLLILTSVYSTDIPCVSCLICRPLQLLIAYSKDVQGAIWSLNIFNISEIRLTCASRGCVLCSLTYKPALIMQN